MNNLWVISRQQIFMQIYISKVKNGKEGSKLGVASPSKYCNFYNSLYILYVFMYCAHFALFGTLTFFINA